MGTDDPHVRRRRRHRFLPGLRPEYAQLRDIVSVEQESGGWLPIYPNGKPALHQRADRTLFATKDECERWLEDSYEGIMRIHMKIVPITAAGLRCVTCGYTTVYDIDVTAVGKPVGFMVCEYCSTALPETFARRTPLPYEKDPRYAQEGIIPDVEEPYESHYVEDITGGEADPFSQ